MTCKPPAIWAFEQKSLKPYARIVLMHLAERARGHRVCWPSAARIAEDEGISPREAQKAIALLLKQKFLTLIADPAERRRLLAEYGGRHGTRSNMYRINRPADATTHDVRSDAPPQTTHDVRNAEAATTHDVRNAPADDYAQRAYATTHNVRTNPLIESLKVEVGDSNASPTHAHAREPVQPGGVFGDQVEAPPPLAAEPAPEPIRAKQRSMRLNQRSLAQRQSDDMALAMFETIYPRPDDPEATKREWNKLMRSGVSAVVLITAARLYADHVVPTLSSPQFIKKAHNWLHDKAWKNAPPAKPETLAEQLARIAGLTPEQAHAAQPQPAQQKHMLLAIDGERAA